MQAAIIAFVLAVGCLQMQASLPVLWPCLLAVAGLLALVCWQADWRWWIVPLLAGLLGFSYAGWRAESRLQQWLAPELEQQTLSITGTVLGLPQPSRYGPRIRFAVEQAPAGVPDKITLTDYAKPAADWQPGQRWQLKVRLKRPHGSANPGSGDYAGWLLGEGIGATGSVAKQDRQLLDAFVATPINLLHASRAALAQRVHSQLGARPYTEIIVALVVGEQAGIGQAQWQLFRDTGITHLVSISGLHVTLVAALVGSLAGWLWGRSTHCLLRLPRRKVAILAGIAAALAYSLLAGFSVPTQRTCFMVAIAGLAMLSGRSLAASTIWLLALACTVLLDPWAVRSAGFWLSYLTVGAMLWAASAARFQTENWRAKLGEWGVAQWAASLGSLPLLAVLFQQFPLVSPLANAVAIPVIGSLATPLALAGVLDPTGCLLTLSHALIAATLALIGPLAQAGWVWTQAAPPLWALLPALLATALLLLPRAVPGKLLGVCLLLPLLWPATSSRTQGSYRATVFDVGQGLSVLVETAHHRLLFDTGAPGAGARVVPPALRSLGVRQLDMLVLSHDDDDHAGAAADVLAAVQVDRIIGVSPRARPDQPITQAPPVTACQAGQRWEWDGIRFSFLHPGARVDAKAKDNARSCVLRVDGPGGSLLLPADIGRHEEASLLAEGSPLKADVLVIPHHGSASSSSPEFVAAVAPTLAIATAGYRNHFRHPRAEVIARYEAANATVWRSDRDGAVIVDVGLDGWQARRWRAEEPHYWDVLLGANRIVATTRLPGEK
ncbi:DNA internalization-related competence protein ComEC/Rec2 [Chitinimonas sp. BJYL2]|uniref:DNA internalization-related competence protein ComEC/Rec2 n=1 Tax=Chitinimonas sp. BJYL2 TaxID=2976696 RepID=UPI0022B57F56|nr:DNA internalization-related competence protein ComEC/Rec2 [Chitinimonas sp. BJYL2]